MSLIRLDKKDEQIMLMGQIAKSISKKHKKIDVDSDKDYKKMLDERCKKACNQGFV